MLWNHYNEELMKQITIGLKYEIEEKITKDQAASAIGSGALNVFGTPSMIALMEKTAMLSVEKFLDSTETTVGTAVNIRHKRATAIGSKVICESKVVSIDGSKIDFEVEVRENGILIGDGYHTRYVVNKDRFMRSL